MKSWCTQGSSSLLSVMCFEQRAWVFSAEDCPALFWKSRFCNVVSGVPRTEDTSVWYLRKAFRAFGCRKGCRCLEGYLVDWSSGNRDNSRLGWGSRNYWGMNNNSYLFDQNKVWRFLAGGLSLRNGAPIYCGSAITLSWDLETTSRPRI